VRVKLDENLPDSVLSILGRAGHDVDTARAEGLRGAKDPALLAGATADGRLLLTLDRSLGDIRAYPPGTHAGIVVVRLKHQSPRAIRDAVERISVTVDFADLRGCVAVWRRRPSRPSALTVTTPRASRTMRDSVGHRESPLSRR
jgi:predicted nuclease of predicted toxin-antitoxin system